MLKKSPLFEEGMRQVLESGCLGNTDWDINNFYNYSELDQVIETIKKGKRNQQAIK